MKRDIAAFFCLARTLGLALLFCLSLAGSSRAAVSAQFWPDSLDFGDIPTGATVTRTFWVKNTGTDSLIKEITSNRIDVVRYTLSQSSIRLAAGDSVEVTLGIMPLVNVEEVYSRILLSEIKNGIEYTSLDFIGPIITYRSVTSGLDWRPWQFRRSLYPQQFVVTGSRAAALRNAGLSVIPDSIALNKLYADQDSFLIGVEAGPTTPSKVYKLLFTDGASTLDSLHFQVIESWPRVYPSSDSLRFSSQSDIDTLVLRGLDLWPGCTFQFASSFLTVLSADLSADTLVRLAVRLERRPTAYTDTLRVSNPDNTYMRYRTLIHISADALPLAPESGAPGAALPRAFSLGANVPNPFNPSTSITYSVGGEAPVTVHLSVFNLRGQVVAVLVDRVIAPGQYTVNWDGRGRGGEQLSSGVYFYRLTAGDFNLTRKMVLLK
ncbi:T9SS type A sorting domain-containing protein [bacterium]|nr:T9SS type A sorting domain-containing protein [bacterium]